MSTKDLGNFRNEKIETLGLEALRSYACPKVNGSNEWYIKCIECPGLETCTAGKRAVDILNDQTAPTLTTKQKKKIASMKGAKTMRDSAVAKIKSIFEGCPTTEEMLLRYLKMKLPESKVNNIHLQPYKWGKYTELVHYHNDIKILCKELYRLTKTYPKETTCAEVISNIERRMTSDVPWVNIDEDEISLADFLEEHHIPERVPEELRGEERIIQRLFVGRQEDICKKIRSITGQISDLESERKDLESQLDIINKAASMFGFGPVNDY